MVKKKKKILIFSVFLVPSGGAEVALLETLKRLKSEFEFHIVTSWYDKKMPRFQKMDGHFVYRVGLGYKFDRHLYVFLGAKKGKELHAKHDFYKTYALMENWSALANMRFNKIVDNPPPSILNMQSGDSIEYIKAHIPFGFWNTYKKIYVSFDHIASISNFLKERAVDFGADRKIIDVIPNGVDLKNFDYSKLKKSKLVTINKKIRKNKGEFVIFTASRIVYKNNLGNVIEAMKNLPNNYRFVVAGFGDLKEELKEKAKKTGKKIDFIGFVPHSDLPYYLAASDVFIRPSFSEGFGNSFIEAMAMRVPIIGTNVGGIPDFLTNNKTGLFCDPNSPKDIAAKIKQACENKKLRKTLVSEGLKKAKQYSWDPIAKKVGKVLQ